MTQTAQRITDNCNASHLINRACRFGKADNRLSVAASALMAEHDAIDLRDRFAMHVEHVPAAEVLFLLGYADAPLVSALVASRTSSRIAAKFL